VTVLATSTGNDLLSQFNLSMSSLTLTSKSGNTVTVFSTPQSAEFMHLNGTVEPLITVKIPQDTYVSATASVGYAYGSCVALDPSTSQASYYDALDEEPIPASDVTVNLSAPITVTGTSMGLALNLQVSKSASAVLENLFTNCQSTPSAAVPITPTFNLTPVTIAAQPTNSTNGMATGLRGLIGTVAASGTSFSVTAADGPTWQVASNNSTVFQGISGASQLAAGMPVEMDVAIQADGSLVAMRVAVYDTNTASLSVVIGPLMRVYLAAPYAEIQFVENQGLLWPSLSSSDGIAVSGGDTEFGLGNPVYKFSSQFTNVGNLPFTANFSASSMVAGQNDFITTHAISVSSETPASTITLLPQTINGTVSSISSSGGFTTYTVTLAAYDLFPNLATQQAQTTVLTNPNTVVVYADENTQMLNATPIAVGSVVRFNGLVFNDNGTLRMDCAQINDGVAE
jgi:hypothetical protein